MANPDTRSSVTDSLTTAVPVSIFFVLVTLLLFQFRDSIPSFTLVLWLLFPSITFVITFLANIITQYINCGKVNAGKAALGALPSLATVFVGLGVGSITYCRIPVASVFTPLLVGKTVDITKNESAANINSIKNNNSKECCVPRVTLESVEDKYPLIAGLSYGFYIMFASLFGMVIGSGFSSIC
jgi:hypothetical protein